MADNYENVSRSAFEFDLQNKDSVLILKKDMILCGFSTQAVWSYNVEGRDVRIVFSGDTIVEDSARVSFALPVAFGHYLNSTKMQDPNKVMYYYNYYNY